MRGPNVFPSTVASLKIKISRGSGLAFTGWPVTLIPILCCNQFGEFPWPAWAVAAHKPGELPKLIATEYRNQGDGLPCMFSKYHDLGIQVQTTYTIHFKFRTDIPLPKAVGFSPQIGKYQREIPKKWRAGSLRCTCRVPHHTSGYPWNGSEKRSFWWQ